MTLTLATLGLLAISPTLDSQSGLKSWTWKDDSIEVTLTQRLPDQSRAYFHGRGFEASQANEIAEACVFQVVIRNNSATEPLYINLADWRVTSGAKSRPLRLHDDWQTRWQQTGTTTAAQVAFRWSLFPTVQQFQPGDWNMGMVTMDLPHESRFVLSLRWQAGGKQREFKLSELRCAPDRRLAPEGNQ